MNEKVSMDEERHKFAKEFSGQYKSFDKSVVFNKLNDGYTLDEAFHLLVPAAIKHIARKHGLPEDKWDQIYSDLIADRTDERIKLFLAQSIKYSIKNGVLNMELGKLVEVLEKSNSSSVKSEIVWALGYQIMNFFSKKSNKTISENLVNQINSIIKKTENEINTESISFLNGQIRDHYYVNDGKHQQKTERKIKVSADHYKKPIKASVTKNQQTIKMKYKNNQSEESTDTTNVVGLFKNRKTNIRNNLNTEPLPIIAEEKGSDQSIFRTTMDEIKHFYMRMKNGLTIKKTDKDEYLPRKFLKANEKWFLGGSASCIKTLVIDRMIADIFAEISKKQMLIVTTINLLMQCINKLDELEKTIFDGFNWRENIEKEFESIKNDNFIVEFLQISNNMVRVKKEEIILSEIKKIRIAAVSAIYNCTARNKTILNNVQLSVIQKSGADDDDEFKNYLIKISRIYDNGSDIDYKKLFNQCLEHIEKDGNIEQSIIYIHEQSKDENRCKELFNENIIIKISQLLVKVRLSETMKIYACTIINNYLERSYTKALNETQLRNYSHLIDDPENSEDLKIEAVKSIILSVKKEKDLPEFMIEILIKNINKGNVKLENFIVLVINIISEQKKIKNIDKLSTKLLEDWVIVEDGIDISFERSSQDNYDCPSISSIAAQIFVNSLQKQTELSGISIENLVKALDSNDKQTCVLSAKSLYLVSETHQIKDEILDALMEHIDSSIPGVCVYLTVVYARSLAKLSIANKSIMKNHIDFLSNIYISVDLQLGEENFTDEVNRYIFDILLNEAVNYPFEEDIFQIFDNILKFKDDYHPKVIQILTKYSAKKYPIQGSTIAALENVVSTSELSDQLLEVLKNIVDNGQDISEKMLRFIADNFYFSDNDKVRYESFDTLDKANDNQDITDSIFDILELERASVAISQCYSDANEAIAHLSEQAKKGKKMTIDAFRALSAVICQDELQHNEDTLKILLNVSNNRQIIPNDLIDRLAKIFNPKLVQPYFTEIFENLVRNNQNISAKLSQKLEEALSNELLYDQVLFIFVLQGQKGKSLSKNIIRKILDKCLTIENPSTMQQYVSFICSVIEKKDYFSCHPQNRTNEMTIAAFETALIHALKIDNQDVISKSISGLKTLISLHRVELKKENIDVLLKIAKDTMCDVSIKVGINDILSNSKLESKQKKDYELVYLVGGTDAEFIDVLDNLDKPELLEQNFDRINSIIDTSSELKLQALKVLLNCSNKKNIPDNLLDSIASLSESSSISRIKSQCCKLISEIAKTGRVIPDKILSLISDQKEKEKSTDKQNLTSKNPTISEETTMNSTSFSEKLIDMRKEFDRNQKFSDPLVQELLALDLSKHNIQNTLELIDIYALILLQDPVSYLKPVLIDSLENAIIFEIINQNILNAYKEIIKQKKCQTNHFSDVFDVFINILNRDENHTELHFDILICIALASEATKILNVEHLENNLDHENEMIRSWSFRGLRAAQEKGSYSSVFWEWCINIAKKLEEKTQITIDIDSDLDLIETIVSLKFINFNQIQGKPKKQWNRELLIFDLIERFQISEGERFQFYQLWLQIEEQESYTKGKSTIILKLLHRFLINNPTPFEQCYQTIKILKQVKFKDIQDVLVKSKTTFIDLNKECLVVIINRQLSNQGEICPEYINKLASTMLLNLGFDISVKILDALSTTDNLKALNGIISFCQENNITECDIDAKKTTLPKLKRSLEIKVLSREIKLANNRKLDRYLNRLSDKNWTFEQLNDLFTIFKRTDNEKKDQYMVLVLEVLSNYQISPLIKENILLALENSPENWLKEVNNIAIEKSFSDKSQEKNFRELISELIASNRNLDDITETKLIEWIEKLKNPLQVISSSCFNQKPIPEWTKDDIQVWTKKVKQCHKTCSDRKDFIIEALLVIKQATYLHTGFHLTDTQILSCLLALNPNTNQGRLLQVGTGEGKSTIISVLAVFYALYGQTVDIITSSPVLAERDAKEKAKFYNMFGLSCSHNNDKAVYISGLKTCYKKEIVYGEVAQFQFDTLRTEYAQLNTLGTRKFEVAIVDEVDSMLIDDSSKTARLSTTMSGIDQLQIIYHLLWDRLCTLLGKVIEIDNKCYLFYGKIEFNEKKTLLKYENEQGDISSISDLKKYLASKSDISEVGYCISENGFNDDFIKNHLESFIKSMIEKGIKIPKNFVEFLNIQIHRWIENVIVAFNYQENVHYIVHEGLIKPVDYFSTGIIQSSSNWSDGLHQFLQIKHNLKMTSETFTTNFLSNRGYFTKYRSNLFGLTGTLGSENAKQVLADIYNVDFVLIPSLRRKQHISFPDLVVDNEREWLNEVCSSAMNESSKERGTLIICETIERCKIIEERLQEKYRSSAVKLYTMNDMDQEKNIEIINCGEIIVATNLAGRGTDIKTNNIEKYGGLHVIVTFMPPNKRVEEQAFGRTSRQGKRGTSQKILNVMNLIHYEHFDIENITQLRDTMEANMLHEFEQNELKVITLKDELFAKFCSLLNEIREKIRKKENVYSHIKQQVKNVFVDVNPSVIESNTLLSIEEQWAMFLRKIDDEKLDFDCEKIHEDYRKFSEKITNDYAEECVIKNPYYYILIGNDLIIHDSSLHRKCNEAMKYFNRAIELDPDHCATAFVGRGWVLLKSKEKFFGSNKQCCNYKDEAVKSFKKALQILGEEMGSLTCMQACIQQRCENIDTPLFKQLIQKSNILGTYCNSIENLLNIIRKSQRLIEITKISNDSRNVENKGVSQVMISHKEIEKGIGKWCDIRLIPADRRYHWVKAIENCQLIVIVKDHDDQFTAIYKNKQGKTLDEWIVDDSRINNCLKNLPYNGEILDRHTYPRIYTQIYTKIKTKNGFVRADFLEPLEILPNDGNYEVTFNDLTTRKECGTQDQAIETINRATGESSLISYFDFRRRILNSEYEDISVSLYQMNLEKLRELFDPNVKIHKVSKSMALKELKDKSSFFDRHVLPDSVFIHSLRVTLNVTLDGSKILEKENLLVKDAIQIIEKQKEDNIHCNITFISANNTGNVMKNKIVNRIKLAVEFINLQGEEVLQKLTEIVTESISLQIFDEIEKLSKVIQVVNIRPIELHSTRNEQIDVKKTERSVNKIVLERGTKEMSGDTSVLRLFDVNREMIIKVVDMCPNAKFNLSFINSNFESLFKGIGHELVNIHFDELERTIATNIIALLREKNFDFSLTFKNLKNSQVGKLIDVASVDQEDIQIDKIRNLRELFMKELRPDLELSEFSGRGIEYLIEISEKNFVPWFSIAAVVSLAGVQAAVGGCLIGTGFGSSLGMSLIAEGLADLVTAYRGYKARQFSWSDYGKQKAVSLIISGASIGFSAIKNAGIGASTLVTTIGEEAVELTVTSGKTAGHKVIQSGTKFTTKNLLRIARPACQKTLKVTLTQLANVGSNFALERLKPQISDSIQCEIMNTFLDPDLYVLMRKMYAFDKTNKNEQFKGKIKKSVIKIVDYEHSFCRKKWDSIGTSLCTGILSYLLNTNSEQGLPNMGERIVATVNGLYELKSIIKEMFKHLRKKVLEMDQKHLSLEEIVRHYCVVDINENDMKEILSRLQKYDKVQLNEKLKNPYFCTELNQINFSGFETHKDNIVNFLKLLHITMSTINMNDFSELMKLLSDTITEQVLRIVKSQLISPWSSFGIDQLSKITSNKLRDYFVVDEKQNSEKQEREFSITETQIQSNVEDYNIANNRYVQQIDETIETYASGVRMEMPADISDIVALANEYSLELKIVDNSNYQLTDEDMIRRTNIVLHVKRKEHTERNSSIEQFQLLFTTRTEEASEIKRNDSGYSIIQKILQDRNIDISIVRLRQVRARIIENNPQQFFTAQRAQKWTEDRHSEAADILLPASLGRQMSNMTK
ncbi:unnamed protein product [Adineta steineri]|uniref:Protein translocase subunit SecA n=1 Tax=Adineta steineri TaxID=433720 RepID=A0A815NV16_9BILA|nr:unnamed protein product [Adineta steineri]CAF3937828.1 unnamed protein product [Adineta steineri]